MVMYRLVRLFLVVLLAGGVVVSAGEAALACSCAVGDPVSRLAESDAAFVGRLISSAEPVPDSEGNISTADPVAWMFEVEEAVKGDLETPLTVMSPWSGAYCGFEVRIGERIGVLLREDGGWRSGLCSQLDADVLLRAAVPLPTPTSDGPRYWTEHGEVWALPAGSRSPTQLASFDTPLLYGALPVAGVGRARAGPRDLLSDDQRPDYDGHRYFHCPGGNDDEHSTATLGRPLRGIGRRRSRRSRRQCPGTVAGRGLTGASRSRRTRMAFENPPTKKIGMTCGIQVASHRPD